VNTVFFRKYIRFALSIRKGLYRENFHSRLYRGPLRAPHYPEMDLSGLLQLYKRNR
jgi:hypothetical protein